jgi:hypothetical protein
VKAVATPASKPQVQSNVFGRTTEAVQKAVLYSLVLGFLPLAFIANVGLKYLMSFFLGTDLIRGLSARSLGRALEKLYAQFIGTTQHVLAQFLPVVQDDEDQYGLQRIYAAQAAQLRLMSRDSSLSQETYAFQTGLAFPHVPSIC